MSEAELERKLVAWAKEQGAWTRKFSSPSQRGVPDRIFIGKAGVLFLELKAPGKKPTELQLREINEINKHGGPTTAAMWSDDLEGAKQIITLFCIL